MKWIISGLACTACYAAGRFFYENASEFWAPLIMFWAGMAYMLIYAAISEGWKR